jgi:hypothetical protein
MGESMCDINMEKSFIVSTKNPSITILTCGPDEPPKFDATDEIISWARESNHSFIDLNVFGNPIDPTIMSREEMV